MKNFEDIKNLWQQQQVTPQLDVNEMLSIARKNTKSIKSKLLRQSFAMLVMFVYIIWVMMKFDFERMQVIALVIVELLVIVYGSIRFSHYLRLRKINFADEPINVLKQSVAFHRSLKWANSTGFNIYATLLFIGLCFYSAPFWNKLSMAWKIGYGVFLPCWFAFTVFFLAKRMYRKQKKQMEEIIERLKQQIKGLHE